MHGSMKNEFRIGREIINRFRDSAPDVFQPQQSYAQTGFQLDILVCDCFGQSGAEYDEPGILVNTLQIGLHI